MSFRLDTARATPAEWSVFVLLPLALALSNFVIMPRFLPELSAFESVPDHLILVPAIVVVAISGLMYLVGMVAMVALMCCCKNRCSDHNPFGKALADALRNAASAADTLGARLRSADTKLEQAASALDIEVPAVRFRTKQLNSLGGIFSAAPDSVMVVEIDQNTSTRPFSIPAGHLRDAIDPPTIALSTCADSLRNAAHAIDQ